MPRIYYGWVIVLITFISSMTTAGIGGYGLSFFLIPMSEALNVSRTEFSAITVFRLISLPIIPIIGLFIDRKNGARIIMSLGGLAGGISLIMVSRVNTLIEFFLIFGVVFGFATTAIGGQLVGPAVLSKWFVKQRGRVMAISAIGISGGGLVIAPLAGWLIQEFGWRMAWVALGSTMLIAVVPISALFMRRQPEDMELLPDGATLTHAENEAPTEIEYSWSTKRALQTKALWSLLLVQSLGLFSLMPVLFHQVAFMQDKGFSVQESTTIATMLAGFAIIGKVIYGYFAEKYSIKMILGFCLIPAGLSLLLLINAKNLIYLYAYAIIHGITMGGFPPMMNVVWASYFGRANMGSIRGVTTPLGNIIGALSPLIAGWMWDSSGDYTLAFNFFVIAWILGGLTALLTSPPRYSGSIN